ncbi:MAG: hypothetical protein ACI9F9_003424, partial [Candidatus Paceibacteria bacterium]
VFRTRVAQSDNDACHLNASWKVSCPFVRPKAPSSRSVWIH